MRKQLILPELLARADFIETEGKIATITILDWILAERSPTIEELKALYEILTAHDAVTREVRESPTRREDLFNEAEEKLAGDFNNRRREARRRSKLPDPA